MSKIPLNLENFNRICDYLYLSEKPSQETTGRLTTYLSAKTSQLSKKVQGEARCFFSYGCSREEVSKILLIKLEKETSLVGKVTIPRFEVKAFPQVLDLFKTNSDYYQKYKAIAPTAKNTSAQVLLDQCRKETTKNFFLALGYVDEILKNSLSLKELQQLKEIVNEYSDKLNKKYLEQIQEKIESKEKQIVEGKQPRKTELKKFSPVTSKIKNKFQKAVEENRLTERTMHPDLVNVPLKNGQLPLHYAIRHCGPHVIELLLPHADLQVVGKEGFNAFDYAVQMSKTSLAERIMERSIEKDWSDIQKSCEKVKKTQESVREELHKKHGDLVPWISIQQKSEFVYEKIKAGSTQAVIEKILEEPAIVSAQYVESKQTLFHLAVEQKNEVLLVFLLSIFSELNGLEDFLELKDINGNTAIKLAEGNKALAGLFNEFKNKKLSERTRLIYFKEIFPLIAKIGKQAEMFEYFTKAVQRGYNGNHSGLVLAIQNSDYQAFIRNYLDGADLTTMNPKTRETLAHLAVKHHQPEILYFLFLSGMNLQVKGLGSEKEIGITPLELAKKNKNQSLIDLLTLLEDIQKSQKNISRYFNEHKEVSVSLKERIIGLEKNIEDYVKVYKKKLGEYTEEEKEQRLHLAKHGLAPYKEACHGHNQLLFSAIIEGDLNTLIQCAELGANLNTTGVSYGKALEDPMGYGAKFTKAHKNFVNELHLDQPEDEQSGVDYVLTKVVEKTWGKKRGDGKSLLDVAVIYGKNEEDNLEIIAYLLSQGLDPWKLNDEGESPISLALVKGQLKVASLMMNHARFAEGKNPEMDLKAFNRAFMLLSEGSQVRDPLRVSSAKVAEGFFAATYLLSSYYLGSLNFLQFLPLIASGFISGYSYREAFAKKAEAPLPKIVYQIYPTISKVATLEMAILPKSPIGTLASSAMGLYLNTRSLFSSFKASVGNLTSRPGQVVYKMGMEGLGMAQNILRFKSLFSYMFFKPHVEEVCQKIDPKDYEEMGDTKKRLRREELNPNCPEHAKILLSNKFDQEAYQSIPTRMEEKMINPTCPADEKIFLYEFNQKSYNEYPTQIIGKYKNIPLSYVDKLFRQNSARLHPLAPENVDLKAPYHNHFAKLKAPYAKDSTEYANLDLELNEILKGFDDQNSQLLIKLDQAKNTLLGLNKPVSKTILKIAPDGEPTVALNRPTGEPRIVPSRFKSLTNTLSHERMGIVWNTALKASIIWGSTSQFVAKIPGVSMLSSPHFWTVLGVGSMIYRGVKGY